MKPTAFFAIDGTRASDSWSEIKVAISSDSDTEYYIQNTDGMVRVACDKALAVEADEGTAPLVLPGIDECTTELNVIQGPSITILAKPRED